MIHITRSRAAEALAAVSLLLAMACAPSSRTPDARPTSVQAPPPAPAATDARTPPPAPAATDAQAPPSTPTHDGGIAGAWMHREMPVRYLETMTLAVSGETVTGTGTYMMEGGRTGPTTIGGTYRGGALDLRITRNTGVKEQYDGKLDGGKLVGQLTIDGNAQPFDFERQPPQ